MLIVGENDGGRSGGDSGWSWLIMVAAMIEDDCGMVVGVVSVVEYGGGGGMSHPKTEGHDQRSTEQAQLSKPIRFHSIQN